MSKNFTLTLVVCAAVVSGGSYIAKSFLSPASLRQPSSAEVAEKKKNLISSPEHGPKRTFKLSSPIRTQVVPVSEYHPGQTNVLRGTITSQRDMDNVEVRWQLPAGLEILSGQTEFTIPHLKANQAYDFEIQIADGSAENKQIHLLASVTLGSQRTSHGVQFNTISQ